MKNIASGKSAAKNNMKKIVYIFPIESNKTIIAN